MRMWEERLGSAAQTTARFMGGRLGALGNGPGGDRQAARGTAGRQRGSRLGCPWKWIGKLRHSVERVPRTHNYGGRRRRESSSRLRGRA